MNKTDAMIGRVFGHWTVKELSHKTRYGIWYVCVCSCGNSKPILGVELRRGKTRSCGHDGSRYRHGKARRGNKTTEYLVWALMRNRCNNPNAKGYSDYGGRGIKVCERWNDFDAFLQDMGKRPSPQHSIDRFPNNDGNYEPGNCRWATRAQQRRNSRRILNITRNGVTMCAKDWCSQLGISYGAAYQRAWKKGTRIEDEIFGKEVQAPCR